MHRQGCGPDARQRRRDAIPMLCAALALALLAAGCAHRTPILGGGYKVRHVTL